MTSLPRDLSAMKLRAVYAGSVRRRAKDSDINRGGIFVCSVGYDFERMAPWRKGVSMIKKLAGACNLLGAIVLAAGILGAGFVAGADRLTGVSPASAEEKHSEPMSPFKTWRDLKVTQSLSSDGSVNYYCFPLQSGTKAHLCVLDLKSKSYCVRPSVNSPTCPTTTSGAKSGAIAAVNGGFFNLSNGESTSYVVIDGKQICDPSTNKDLVTNPKLMPFLDTIFNRSELRIDKSGVPSVAAHRDLHPKGEKAQYVIGGGPQLLPKLTAKEEAFIRTGSDGKQVDSIGCNKTAARTAIGITSDDHFLILCVAGKGQDEFSSGITLEQLALLLSNLGCKRALNFDGGTSTTMAIADKSSAEGSMKMVCGREPETRVKSTLLVVPRK